MKLFGTDGIRDKVTSQVLHPDSIRRIGYAAGCWLDSNQGKSVIIGKDTRDSCDKIQESLLSGLGKFDIKCTLVGVLPTPAIAFLTKKLGFSLGISISASHNPPEYNGIKFISSDGLKISDEAETIIEKYYETLGSITSCHPNSVNLPKLAEKYLDYICNIFSLLDLNGLHVAVDIGNGATITTAKKVLEKLGAMAFELNNTPNGTNINVNCGAMYPNVVAKKVLEMSLDAGISFDGDGDRAIMSDELGNILDGDNILAILANHLKPKSIVGTIMTNLGLEKFLKENNTSLIRTNVGDRWVSDAMISNNIPIGGETSGHVIIRDIMPTGDGLVTALSVLQAMKAGKSKLSKLGACLVKTPQILINVPVARKLPIDEVQSVREKISACENKIANIGRLAVRYSGTENVCRIMVEAPEESTARKIAKEIEDTVINSPICKEK